MSAVSMYPEPPTAVNQAKDKPELGSSPKNVGAATVASAASVITPNSSTSPITVPTLPTAVVDSATIVHRASPPVAIQISEEAALAKQFQQMKLRRQMNASDNKNKETDETDVIDASAITLSDDDISDEERATPQPPPSLAKASDNADLATKALEEQMSPPALTRTIAQPNE